MNTKFSLQNKTVLVTGGGSCIGKAIATTFAAQGAQVHILDFNKNSALETANEITEQGFFAQAHLCDVSKYNQVMVVVETISKTSKITTLLFTSGIAHVGNLEPCSDADLDRLSHVNFSGIFHCSTAVISEM